MPDRNIKVSFRQTTAWGHTRYRENDLVASQKAQQRHQELISQSRYIEAN